MKGLTFLVTALAIASSMKSLQRFLRFNGSTRAYKQLKSYQKRYGHGKPE